MVDLRVEEAKNINGSLSSLGRVIQCLKSNQSFIPWRDSSLTMLLKESLSGNVRTALVVTVSGRADMMGESLSSLKFGLSCGNLKNSVVKQSVNVD
jgi:hypothetical protein